MSGGSPNAPKRHQPLAEKLFNFERIVTRWQSCSESQKGTMENVEPRQGMLEWYLPISQLLPPI